MNACSMLLCGYSNNFQLLFDYNSSLIALIIDWNAGDCVHATCRVYCTIAFICFSHIFLRIISNWFLFFVPTKISGGTHHWSRNPLIGNRLCFWIFLVFFSSSEKWTFIIFSEVDFLKFSLFFMKRFSMQNKYGY